ncbi:MerR family DNA-binding transcriptional regulator [Pelotomaculum propionicicum]|uniref:MerR family DNA-binding transcriptional regulator n=1 Tax=Pelotomaculum propionicicum TaxID=258475 RepID=UPI003B76E35D
MKTYKTSQIAALCGVHPNTVRLYEELGYIPPVPRAKNGYRLYSELHLEYVRLVRTALKSTWLGGIIRKKALSVVLLSAAGSFEEAMQLAREHLTMVREERGKAEIAAGLLETWAADRNIPDGSAGPYWKSSEAAERLDITYDMLRSWERNGLITVPRDPDNGYRVFGKDEIRRLYVIRALRKARFSLMSIYNMFRHYDRGVREGLAGILDELPPDEEDIIFNTNQWLSKIKTIEEYACELIDRLTTIIKYVKK